MARRCSHHASALTLGVHAAGRGPSSRPGRLCAGSGHHQRRRLPRQPVRGRRLLRVHRRPAPGPLLEALQQDAGGSAPAPNRAPAPDTPPPPHPRPPPRAPPQTPIATTIHPRDPAETTQRPPPTTAAGEQAGTQAGRRAGKSDAAGGARRAAVGGRRSAIGTRARGRGGGRSGSPSKSHAVSSGTGGCRCPHGPAAPGSEYAAPWAGSSSIRCIQCGPFIAQKQASHRLDIGDTTHCHADDESEPCLRLHEIVRNHRLPTTCASDNTSLRVSIGPSSSEDSDYSQITETFTLTSKSFPITPVNLTVSTGDGYVSLDWDQVSNATGYNVYYDEMSGVTDNDSIITGITDDNYTLSNLQNNTTYYFRVASINSNGISALSSEVSATPSSNNSSSDFSCSDNASTCISWSDNFTQGSGATTSQITRYNDFWNSISVDDGWTNISIGNPDNLVTCDNASEIIGLYKSGSDGSLVCNNKIWYVGPCGSGMSIAVNSSGDCQCGSNSWTVRPGIGNNNWGGVGKECSAESQTLTVVLGKASSNSSQTDNLKVK